MQDTLQTVVSPEALVNGPVELTFDDLQHVAGGLGPHDNWAASVVVEGPHDNW